MDGCCKKVLCGDVRHGHLAVSRIIPATFVSILWDYYFRYRFLLSGYFPLIVKHKVFIRGLGVLAGLIGLFILLGTLPMWNHQSSSNKHSPLVVVNTITAVNQKIAAANAAHKPVLLDFYADWCESCIIMDKTVFSQPNVKKALAGFVMLRIDLSANKPEDEAMLKYFNVIAPPTVLFFSNQGQEVNARRIVGEVSAADFLSRINLFYAQGCDKKSQC